MSRRLKPQIVQALIVGVKTPTYLRTNTKNVMRDGLGF
jgi:hypothetical protein